MVKIGGKKRTDEEIINYPEPDYLEDDLDLEDEVDLLPTAPKKTHIKKTKLKSPDQIYQHFQDHFKLPIYLTRKDLEQNPKDLTILKTLPSDVRQFLIRYKRSKIDMDLYYQTAMKFLENKGAY